MNNTSVHIRQSEVSTGVMKRQAFMVQTQTMQHGRLNIMHVNR